MVFLNSLKDTSALSSLTESEDEQHLLLHHGRRHTKCSGIPSSVNATASRNRRNEKQNHQFLEQISHIASTGRRSHRNSLFEILLNRLLWPGNCYTQEIPHDIEEQRVHCHPYER